MAINLQYIFPTKEAQLQDAVELFKEYARSLFISLEFQNFNAELDIINSMYGSPTGCLLLVYDNDKALGCAAFRKIGEGICELKRMYIQPAYRGLHIGQAMLDLLFNKAKDYGYMAMRLDTLDSMLPALKLYRSNGFYEIDAYYQNPNHGVVYMEKHL